MDTDAFDLQEIIKVGQFFLCFDILYSLIVAADIVIYPFEFIDTKFRLTHFNYDIMESFEKCRCITTCIYNIICSKS